MCIYIYYIDVYIYVYIYGGAWAQTGNMYRCKCVLDLQVSECAWNAWIGYTHVDSIIMGAVNIIQCYAWTYKHQRNVLRIPKLLRCVVTQEHQDDFLIVSSL